jgi:tripartite ATP-independent transporter DctP family solute receptor
MREFGRRAAIGGLAAGAGFVAVRSIGRGHAASRVTLKLGDELPDTHPLNIQLRKAADRIKQRSNGGLLITLFPNNQLGGSTDMLSQLRSGATEMVTMSGNILSTMLPVVGLYNVPFAFLDYAHVWAAMDGTMGDYLRQQFAGIGLHVLDKHWDNGFRQITSSDKIVNVPEDLHGFKIRVPVSPLWLSLFHALGAAPTPINWSETYTALQTHIVDGQENALTIVETGKLYEVQKHVSMTNHMWDGYYLIINGRVWDRLPPDLRQILTEELNAGALQQRQDMVALNAGLETMLKQKGMVFNQPDGTAFRQALAKSGFYAEWKEKFGAEAWHVLEGFSGPLG